MNGKLLKKVKMNISIRPCSNPSYTAKKTFFIADIDIPIMQYENEDEDSNIIVFDDYITLHSDVINMSQMFLQDAISNEIERMEEFKQDLSSVLNIIDVAKAYLFTCRNVNVQEDCLKRISSYVYSYDTLETAKKMIQSSQHLELIYYTADIKE